MDLHGSAQLRRLQRQAFVTPLVLVLLQIVPIAASGADLQSRQPAFAGSPEILRAQIQNDVMGAIDTNRSAKNYQEYGTSGYTARDVFSNVRALRDANGWQALCQTLDALTPNSLALFEQEIERSEIPCVQTSKTKLLRFWQEGQSKLKQHIAELSKKPRPTKPESSSSIEELKVSIAESPILTRENIHDNEVALTFNDGPDSVRTLKILEILKQTGVRATFFHIGELIRARPEVDHRLVEEKHTLGTHSFSHPDLSRLDLKRAEKQILKGREEAEAASGVDAPLFRAPYGILTDNLRDILKKRKMPVIQFNIDSQDWKLRSPSALYDHVLSEVESQKGGVIELHENFEQSVIVLKPLIEELKARGYHFIVFVPTY